MVRRICFACACLLMASPAVADSIVTWEAIGEVTEVRRGFGFPTPLPPPGTPVSVTLTFAPDQAVPHFTGKPGCMIVDLSASLTIGGHTWTGGGLGFTHSSLPGDSCGTSSLTQFSLHDLTPPPDHPWTHPLSPGPPTIFVLSYRDLLVRDAFPEVPTPSSTHFYNAAMYTAGDFAAWHLHVALHLDAVNQPAPVPEPGTITLLGLGLAAVARARRRR